MNDVKTSHGRGPAPPSGAMHDARKDRRARHGGPFSGSPLRAALALALLSLGACRAPAASDRLHGPVAAELPELSGSGGPGESVAGGEEADDAEDASGADDGEEEAGAPCEDGASRPCRVLLGEHGGVTSCFVGVELCWDGAWGSCGSPPDEP